VANAAAAAAAPAAAGGGSGASNPFQIATNLYAEKNLQGALSGFVPSASSSQQGGAVNAGQYLRGVRLQLRTTTNGTSTVTPTTFDMPWSAFQFADLVNVDGSEILYNMGGYAHSRCVKYFRPWLQDPDVAYDTQVVLSTAAIAAVSGTLFLQPEIRFSACVLANTDTRSQYRFDYTMAPSSAYTGTLVTAPTLAVIPYMDAWAQPDGNDLQGTPNQPVPPGVNLQTKRRHQIFTLNGAGSDNTLLSTLTGNALRGMLLITRSATGVRVDGFSDPFYYQLDNRSLGRLNPDMIRQWASDFYQYTNRGGINASVSAGGGNVSSTAAYSPTGVVDPLVLPGLYVGAGSADVGVYAFPRWIEPGVLEGQGWLYTANSTKLYFESATSTSGTAAATAELVTDEVYPVGAVDPSLIDI
jgi:hypothetical protein